MQGSVCPHGEDLWLSANAFDHKRGGVYFEVGAHNGSWWSVTYNLEKQLGWSGILIEPNPELRDQLVSCRSPANYIGLYALGDRDGMIKLHVPHKSRTLGGDHNAVLGIACADLSIAHKRCFDYSDVVEYNVPIHTYEYAIRESKIDHLDLMVVDVEGYEAKICEGIKNSAVKPDYILCETTYVPAETVGAVLGDSYEVVKRFPWDTVFKRKK